jgi:hypothetical protein
MNKLCKCGCGGETKLSWDKKKINDYINGHGPKGIKRAPEDIERRQRTRKENDLKRILNIPLDLDYPLCQCGCGDKVKHKNDRFISNHQPNAFGMLGKKHSDESKRKIASFGLGKKFTEERKENISKSISGTKNGMFGKKLSIEQKQKLRGRIPWNKGKKSCFKISDEVKLKHSIRALKYIEEREFNGKPFRARIGKNELSIIAQIENNIDATGISNNKDLFLKCGKWPDRYYAKYNLCVDVLETHHFKANGELGNNDQERELIIAKRLSCLIYYIPEQEFLKDPEKEIQRFKDFLTLLDQGRN